MTWEPMPSAPDDGTPFLACQNLDDDESKMAVCYISTSGTLCYEASEGIVDEEDFSPTHWMPLPEPP